MSQLQAYVKDLGWIGPELVLAATALVVLLVELYRRGRRSGWSLGLALVVTLAAGFGISWMGRTFSTALGRPVDLRLDVAVLGLVYILVTMGDLWFKEEKWDRIVPGLVVLVGTLLAGYYAVGLMSSVSAEPKGATVFGLQLVDSFSVYFKLLALASLFVVTLFTMNYKELKWGFGEYYLCLVGAHLGILFLVSSNHLLLIYLGLEMLSLSSYLLAGFRKEDPKSAEAAVKYVIYGGVASAIMLFGFSLIFGLGGSLDLVEIGRNLAGTAQGANRVLVGLGMACTLGGISYKIAAVPFHFWCPDVYEGAPTPVTTFLAVASKAAGFAVIVRLVAVLGQGPGWLEKVTSLMAVASALSMTYGNLGAIHQTNVKRLLAYSSIAHVGYILMAVAALFGAAGIEGGRHHVDPQAVSSILFYLGAYLIMNLGAFGAVIYIAKSAGSEDMDDWWGLGWKLPVVSGMLVIFLLSLTGIPPTVGFYGKWLLFRTAIAGGFLWLAVLAAINTVFSLFYYFRVAKVLFLKPAEESEGVTIRPAAVMAVVLVGLGLLTLLFGVLPSALENLAGISAASL